MSLPWKLIYFSYMLPFAGIFPLMFGFAVVNQGIYAFRTYFNDSFQLRHHGQPISNDYFIVLWTWFATLMNLGAIVGCLLLPLFSEKLGRKHTVIVGTVPMFLSATLMQT